ICLGEGMEFSTARTGLELFLRSVVNTHNVFIDCTIGLSYGGSYPVSEQGNMEEKSHEIAKDVTEVVSFLKSFLALFRSSLFRIKTSHSVVFTMFPIGSTPMVYLNKIAEGCATKIAAKMEIMQPCSSIKDRVALSMIKDAEDRGLISPRKTVLLETSSGNTALVLHLLQQLVAINSIVLKALGAELYITDPAKGIDGVLQKAQEIKDRTPDSYFLRQDKNPANPKCLYK
ncbi:hypothetical protein H5410_002002, partial [Solanum commersonii]